MLGRKKKQEVPVEPSTRELPKAFESKYGSLKEDIEEIDEAVGSVGNSEDEIEAIQAKIDQLKNKVSDVKKPKWEVVERLVEVKRTFVRNNETGQEFILEDGTN